jgi:cation:H+ antiporter
MTNRSEESTKVHPGRSQASLAAALGVAVPGLAIRLLHPDLPHPVEALLFGLAIVGAAFLLSWAAEVAQLDISAGLAIAVLALIAVLPEYAVDFVFASKGGNSVQQFGASCPPLEGGVESPCSLALANMTGANRLLIGIGWSMVIFIAWYRVRATHRREGRQAPRWEGVRLNRGHSVEIAYLAVATIYSLTLPLKHSITLIDAVVLVGIFVAYTWRISRAPAEEPHLVGPAEYLGTLRTGTRRTTIVVLFVGAAAIILLCAEPFAESLVATGAAVGISEFLLVQWLAPLASEAPELLVVALYAWRLKTGEALTAVVSSKINQWTLLVGTLPLVFAIASGSLHGLPVEPAQREEVLLTAAQTVFAVAILVNLSISLREAFALFGLFWAQFILGAVVPPSAKGLELLTLSAVYLLIGVWLLARRFGDFRDRLRDGLRVSYSELEPEATTQTQATK